MTLSPERKDHCPFLLLILLGRGTSVAKSCAVLCFLTALWRHAYFLNWLVCFLAMLGLHCCTQAVSSCGQWELLSSCARAFTEVAPLVTEHRVSLAPWHMESSRTRNRTLVSCIGWWILNDWTTKKSLLVTSCCFFPLVVLHFIIFTVTVLFFLSSRNFFYLNRSYTVLSSLV